jgi:hypothetical protein
MIKMGLFPASVKNGNAFARPNFGIFEKSIKKISVYRAK